jgi:hypothetical protein
MALRALRVRARRAALAAPTERARESRPELGPASELELAQGREKERCGSPGRVVARSSGLGIEDDLASAAERHRLGSAADRVELARADLRRDAVIFGPGIASAAARFEDALR